MLGYDVDFGHMETVSLISAPKYPEKQVKPAVSIPLVMAFFFKWYTQILCKIVKAIMWTCFFIAIL